MRTRRIRFALLCAAAWITTAATYLSAGWLRTLDGQLLEGDIQFTSAGALVVTTNTPEPVPVPVARWQRLTLAATDQALAGSGFEADRWSNEDIGRVSLAGSAGWANNQWYLRGGGGYIGENEDAFHFVNTPLSNDCELVARVIRIASDDRQGRAGLMLRTMLHPRSPFVALLAKADGSLSFRGRSAWGKHAEVKANQPGPTPLWIKLRKLPDRITGLRSIDGQHWQAVADFPLALNGTFHAGLAVANRSPTHPCLAVVAPFVTTVSGLLGEYHGRSDLTDFRFRRIDPRIAFSWGLNAPDPGLGPDEFSIRWTGWIEPRFSEDYTFYYDADDAAQLWIEGRSLPQRSLRREAGPDGETMSLQAGKRYALRMDYREGEGSAAVRLGWSSRSQALEVIPGNRLFAFAGPEPASGGRPIPGQTLAFGLARGVLLRTGTFLAGTVLSLDEHHIKLRRQDGPELTAPLHQVAWVVFRTPREVLPPEEMNGRTGVLLQNGEWFEGEIREFKDRKLRVSSVLHGMRTFNPHQGDVAAWLLNDVTPPNVPFTVRLTDGSVLQAANLRAEPDALVLAEPALGDLRIDRKLLCEVSRQ